MSRSTLLIIEDETDVRLGIATYFSDSGFIVHEAENGRIGLDIFRDRAPDLVFTDLRMPVMDGLEVLSEIRRLSPETPVIVISGTGVVQDAVEALRRGAWDYIVKPVIEMVELERLARRALETNALKREISGLKQKLLSGGLHHPEYFSSIVSRTPAMIALFQYVEVIGPTSQPVLISGETGTGKELVAQAVHAASGRSRKFVAVNVAGLDDQMFADTLFGHVRGAFTGADMVREGLIQQAAGGTLFLDEIGDLKEASQIKLLRLLQEGEYYPLGSDHPRKTNARIVLATHRDLKEMVAKETFRQDLYYRLFAHQLVIPPLRERPGDIPILLEHFLQEAATALNKKKPTHPPELAGYLTSYRFPGNIRELRAMVFEAVARHTQGVLSMETFLTAIGTAPRHIPDSATSDDGTPTITLRDATGERMPTLKEAEECLVSQAMRLARNNQGIAAGYLGINRSALNKKLVKQKNSPT